MGDDLFASPLAPELSRLIDDARGVIRAVDVIRLEDDRFSSQVLGRVTVDLIDVGSAGASTSVVEGPGSDVGVRVTVPVSSNPWLLCYTPSKEPRSHPSGVLDRYSAQPSIVLQWSGPTSELATFRKWKAARLSLIQRWVKNLNADISDHNDTAEQTVKAAIEGRLSDLGRVEGFRGALEGSSR